MGTIKNSDQEKPGYFWQGLLISLILWVLDAFIAMLFYSLLVHNPNKISISIIWTMLFPLGIVLSLIWIPLTIITSARTAKKGIKSSLPLVLVPFIITPIIVPYIALLLIALLGGF